MSDRIINAARFFASRYDDSMAEHDTALAHLQRTVAEEIAAAVAAERARCAGAWADMRNDVLHKRGPLQVNYVLGIIDYHEPFTTPPALTPEAATPADEIAAAVAASVRDAVAVAHLRAAQAGASDDVLRAIREAYPKATPAPTPVAATPADEAGGLLPRMDPLAELIVGYLPQLTDAQRDEIARAILHRDIAMYQKGRDIADMEARAAERFGALVHALLAVLPPTTCALDLTTADGVARMVADALEDARARAASAVPVVVIAAAVQRRDECRVAAKRWATERGSAYEWAVKMQAEADALDAWLRAAAGAEGNAP